MNIGILTIIGNDNYGNRLQNFATQQIVKKIGAIPTTILNSPFTNTKNKYVLRRIKRVFKDNTYSNNKKRANNFKLFNNNIKFSKKYITAFDKNEKYNYCLVGSDQVWNPYMGRLREVDLLSFVEKNKRIAFSASFGVEKITDVDNYTKELINEFKAISVREDAGKKIIDDLTGRKDVEVIIDPTMMLTPEEWDEVSKKPLMLKNDRYILNYFLGELSEERKKEIDRIAKENNCEVINILDKNSPFYESGPSEFLYLEKNAFLICTDSFHSSVFAILYNRPFVIFDREQIGVANMNSRLETLISKFKLKDRKFEGKITDKNLNHDYSEAYKILEAERQKSKEFIEKALGIKE